MNVMHTNRFRETMAAVGICVAAIGAQADPVSGQATGTSAAKEATHDVVGTLVESGHFNTLAKALKAAGLTETLEGTGPFTLFAPTDEAFAQLPSGTLDDLLKPENKATLRGILQLHVVQGNLHVADLRKLKETTTVNGGKVEVTHRFLTGVHIGTPKGTAHVQNSDIKASNGVLHVIDRVLLP